MRAIPFTQDFRHHRLVLRVAQWTTRDQLQPFGLDLSGKWGKLVRVVHVGEWLAPV
jgi:hypothetical protein